MTSPTYQLDEYRFQNDSGSDSSPNWNAAANTDITLTVGSANQLLLRFQHHNTNNKAGNEVWNWEYSLKGGAWTAITGATNVIRAITSAIFTDAQMIGFARLYVTPLGSVLGRLISRSRAGVNPISRRLDPARHLADCASWGRWAARVRRRLCRCSTRLE